jgi:hypothetical protein
MEGCFNEETHRARISLLAIPALLVLASVLAPGPPVARVPSIPCSGYGYGWGQRGSHGGDKHPDVEGDDAFLFDGLIFPHGAGRFAGCIP